MKRTTKIWIGTGSILLLALLIINCIIVFKEDSRIARSYYITDYERVALKQQRAYLNKEAMIIPEEEIRITADANALSQISVRPGQKISVNEEIAAYKTDEATHEQSKLQAELNAYEGELSTLEGILRRLEAQEIDDPITTIDSEQIDDELSITVETEVLQGTPHEAIAAIEKQIAEVERNIDILEDQISELSFSNVLSSPIDGVIGKILEANGTVTFIIYTDEKNLITYISEQEWEKVEENQSVKLNQSLFESEPESDSLTIGEDAGSLEEAEEVVGAVIEKQTIPATNTLWYKEMEKVVEMPQPLSFEVRIDLNDAVTNKPYASLTKAKIIIHEAPSALRVNKDWLITKQVMDGEEPREAAFIRSIDEDGKIQTTEVEIAFEDKGDSILTSALTDDQIIFNKQIKNGPSLAFFPMPFELPSKAALKALDWEQYVKYLVF